MLSLFQNCTRNQMFREFLVGNKKDTRRGNTGYADGKAMYIDRINA